MNFFIAQVLGIFSSLAAIGCVQARSAKFVLLGQFLANGSLGLSYGLLGSLSGAWVCILAMVHSLVISVVNEKAAERRDGLIRVISVLFSLAYVAGFAVTYARWPDLIACICALLFVVTVAQKDASGMRNVMLLSMTLWIIFDICVGGYTNIIAHGATIVSLIAAKLRLDRKQ